MGQKDLTQKDLESYPDVFADTINSLLYEGKQVLLPQDLQPAPTETLYHGTGNFLRNQFHDVSQYVVQDGRVKAQYTLENESNASGKMILRRAGYEGAVYRNQYEKQTKDIFPIISSVLHWGKRRWEAPNNLKDLLKKQNLPESTMNLIDNIQLRVYNMRFLSREVRERFTSDMRIVVDYLAEEDKYIPTNQPILHVEAFLRMMTELSDDFRYEEIIANLANRPTEKGEITMCKLLDKYEAKGEALFASLMECLFRDNRMSDAKLVLTDTNLRKKLYLEYGLSK